MEYYYCPDPANAMGNLTRKHRYDGDVYDNALFERGLAFETEKEAEVLCKRMLEVLNCDERITGS